MSLTKYQDLRIYRLSEELADLIWRIASGWPSLARHTIAQQIVRATDSIGANIAEGAGRGSFKDNRRFVLIARGSLYEVQHWLRRAHKRGLLTPEEITTIGNIIKNLLPQLNAYINSLNR